MSEIPEFIPEVIWIEVADCQAGSMLGPTSDGPLTDVIAWFQEQLEKIPQEHRGTARCELDGDQEWDTYYTHVRVTYTRLETADEVQARAALLEAQAADTAARERAKLLELAAKYPGVLT